MFFYESKKNCVGLLNDINGQIMTDGRKEDQADMEGKHNRSP